MSTVSLYIEHPSYLYIRVKVQPELFLSAPEWVWGLEDLRSSRTWPVVPSPAVVGPCRSCHTWEPVQNKNSINFNVFKWFPALLQWVYVDHATPGKKIEWICVKNGIKTNKPTKIWTWQNTCTFTWNDIQCFNKWGKIMLHCTSNVACNKCGKIMLH